MNTDQLQMLEQFIGMCKAKPELLHMPALGFFKNYIESLGGVIPPPSNKSDESSDKKSPKPEEEEEVEIEEPDSPESDLDIDMEGVIEGDVLEDDQDMGDLSVTEVSEEDMDRANEKRGEGMSFFCDGEFEAAVGCFTEAIRANPLSAPLFAKRASCYVKLGKPNAAIRDCNRAIEINPDSAITYKWRGMSHKLLGNWETAFKDLSMCNRIDFDDSLVSVLKELQPKAHRVQEHQRKVQRKVEEKEAKERRKRVERARRENEKARKKAEMPDMGASGGAGMPPGMENMFSNPDLMSAMNDPEVMAAMNDIMQNPGNMKKYANNPKIQKVMEGFTKQFGGAGGMFGGQGAGAHEGDNNNGAQFKPTADDVD